MKKEIRLILIYMMLEQEIRFSITDLMRIFNISRRTACRDLSTIRLALSETNTFQISLDKKDLISMQDKTNLHENIYKLKTAKIFYESEDDNNE